MPRERRLVLHQNMRRFAGPYGRRRRIDAYLGRPIPARDQPRSWGRAPAAGSYGFGGVRNGAAGGERFAVVGLTELTTAAAGAGLALTRPLTDGGATTYVFNCGRSAFGYQEYSTITVANGVAVLAAGRLTFGPRRLVEHKVTARPPQPWMAQSPGTADYRAAVYVVVRLEPREAPVAVAFLHNVYRERDQRAATMAQVNSVAAAIRANTVRPAAHVYFGGDFNVPAINRLGRQPLFTYEARVAMPMTFPGARPGGTTWGGNLYDYWYSDINPLAPAGAPRPVAFVSSATLDGPRGLMSDHCASGLRIN